MTYTKLRPEHLPAFRHGNFIDVQLDAGFSCTGRGRTRLYYDEQAEDWWFACLDGRHYLAGQVAEDKHGVYFVGVYLDD